MVFFEELRNDLVKGKEAQYAHRAWEELLLACKKLNTDKWSNVYQELLRFEGMEDDYAKYVHYRDRLKEACPKWLKQLEKRRQKGQTVEWPDDVELAWKWRKVHRKIEELRKQPSLEQLEQKMTSLRRKEAKFIRQLVAESTWQAQIERTTPAQKRSLHAWLNAIKRIGKGTGKYTSM